MRVKLKPYRVQLASLAALEPAELGHSGAQTRAASPRVSHGPEAIRSNTTAHYRRAETSSANVRDPKPLRSTGGAKELDYNTLLPCGRCRLAGVLLRASTRNIGIAEISVAA